MPEPITRPPFSGDDQECFLYPNEVIQLLDRDLKPIPNPIPPPPPPKPAPISWSERIRRAIKRFLQWMVAGSFFICSASGQVRMVEVTNPAPALDSVIDARIGLVEFPQNQANTMVISDVLSIVGALSKFIGPDNYKPAKAIKAVNKQTNAVLRLKKLLRKDKINESEYNMLMGQLFRVKIE